MKPKKKPTINGLSLGLLRGLNADKIHTASDNREIKACTPSL